jgi:hypothetical protein
MVTYHPQHMPTKPKPPATFNNIKMWPRSASVAAVGTDASAAAIKANKKTRLVNRPTNSKLTRSVPMRMMKLTMHLFTFCQRCRRFGDPGFETYIVRLWKT